MYLKYIVNGEGGWNHCHPYKYIYLCCLFVFFVCLFVVVVVVVVVDITVMVDCVQHQAAYLLRCLKSQCMQHFFFFSFSDYIQHHRNRNNWRLGFLLLYFINNNNKGHFYGTWSLARSRAQCAVQKAAEKCIKHIQWTKKEKGFRPYDRQPRKNLHTSISVINQSCH